MYVDFPELLTSRTGHMPNTDANVTTADFRTLSIASFILRHAYKVSAVRKREANRMDVRQQCLDDGYAQNIAALAALLGDTRRN